MWNIAFFLWALFNKHTTINKNNKKKTTIEQHITMYIYLQCTYIYNFFFKCVLVQVDDEVGVAGTAGGRAPRWRGFCEG